MLCTTILVFVAAPQSAQTGVGNAQPASRIFDAAKVPMDNCNLPPGKAADPTKFNCYNPLGKTNYDEAKVPTYTLPDPLVMRNGEKVRDAATWNRRRRPELLRLFETNVYGRRPDWPENLPKKLMFEVTSEDRQALGGTAIHKQVTVYFAGRKDGPKMDLSLYLPAGAGKPVPVFLGLSFGNAQGANAQVLARGYGTATADYGNIERDRPDGIKSGVRPLFFKPEQTSPAADEWGAIGAWAWGLSRAMDYLETDKDVDAKRVIVYGHSRLGKVALWAGAQDTRFALVISNESGAAGAALARRAFGETPADSTRMFPYWFCANYKKYADHADQLPVDQHELLALIAPRPLYVACAEEDLWGDPRGSFLSLVAAFPVYKLLGKPDPLGTTQMPGISQPIGNTVGYHIRPGLHSLTDYDWAQYLNFADKQFKK
jgi:hypothetical protein